MTAITGAQFPGVRPSSILFQTRVGSVCRNSPDCTRRHLRNSNALNAYFVERNDLEPPCKTGLKHGKWTGLFDDACNIKKIPDKPLYKNCDVEMRQRSVVKRKDTASGEPLYHPSIFRYKCHGRLQLSSKDVGSSGVCQGLKSQLEHVDHWRLVTRDEGN